MVCYHEKVCEKYFALDFNLLLRNVGKWSDTLLSDHFTTLQSKGLMMLNELATMKCRLRSFFQPLPAA